MEGGRSGETPEGTTHWWSAFPRPPGRPLRGPSARSSLSGLKAVTPPVTCCLVLETHVSSSRSRRERWKAQVVLTAMKMSPSCSSRGPGFGWFSLSVPCSILRDKLEWYRRDRSPRHTRVKRAPARPRKTRQCIGSWAPRQFSPRLPNQSGVGGWSGGGPGTGKSLAGIEGRHRRERSKPGLWATTVLPAGRGHQPATCSSALPPGRAA